jgi:hypothetical protein
MRKGAACNIRNVGDGSIPVSALDKALGQNQRPCVHQQLGFENTDPDGLVAWEREASAGDNLCPCVATRS